MWTPCGLTMERRCAAQVKEVHFCQPPEGTPGTDNQGTLVVFNLDPSMPVPEVHALFSQFGEVKEVRRS